MFVFFPDEPKVGIKTIKQWVKHCTITDRAEFGIELGGVAVVKCGGWKIIVSWQ